MATAWWSLILSQAAVGDGCQLLGFRVVIGWTPRGRKRRSHERREEPLWMGSPSIGSGGYAATPSGPAQPTPSAEGEPGLVQVLIKNPSRPTRPRLSRWH